MNRIYVIVISAILISFAAHAQESKVIDNLNIGADLGLSIPSMRYSSSMYDHYKRGSLFSGMGGLFVDWNFYDNFSVRPHLDFVGRGVRMSYDPNHIDYKLKATYFDVRIPVVYSFDMNSSIRPYFALGPSFNFIAGGKVHYKEGTAALNVYGLKLANGNFRPLDFGVYIGAGFDYPLYVKEFPLIVGAEVGYNIGTVNTFSKAELNNQSIAVNSPVYNVAGARRNGNLTIALDVSIPLKNLFGKRKKSKSKPVVAAVARVEEKMVERTVTIIEKECCSLDEMYDMILNGQDISMKKVCAFTDINFDFDKATLRPGSEEYLDKFVMILHKFPNIHLSIIGHTDNIGDTQYNLILSKRRAEAVAQYFIRNGVDVSRLKCYGVGSRQPLVDNTSSSARAMNRRVEFDIIEN